MEITVGGFAPADTNYFGVRAAEFDPLIFTTDGLLQAGLYMFFYPSAAIDGYVFALSASLTEDDKIKMIVFSGWTKFSIKYQPFF
jgi:hypothetical protein